MKTLALLACLHGTAGVPTPIQPVDLAHVLDRGYRAVFHRAPSPSARRLALAHTLLEGARVSRCHNLGSLSATRRQAHFRPGGHVSSQRMRSFPSFHAAAVAYWGVLRRCRGVDLVMETGSGTRFAAALGACGYYTADREGYARTMEAVLKGLGK